MGKCNTSLSPWGFAGGAFTSPLTDAALAWLNRTPFVSVRDLRDPAASASECLVQRHGQVSERHEWTRQDPAASPSECLVQRHGEGERKTRGTRRAPIASASECFGATPWGGLEKDTRDTPRPHRFGLRGARCIAVGQVRECHGRHSRPSPCANCRKYFLKKVLTNRQRCDIITKHSKERRFCLPEWRNWQTPGT